MDVLTIENLSKVIGNKHILKNVSMSISKGSIYGYLGQNGAGKTTTIRILLGLLSPTSGTVKLLGKDIRECKKQIGFVLHNTGLYPTLTALENLSLYADIYDKNDKKKIDYLLNEVGLYDKRNEKVHTFSRGMKQRLVLARAIVHDPELLILDEPTTGLDIEAKVWFRNFLINLSHNNKTIFISSHEVSELEKMCTHIGILKQGILQVSDSVDGLKKIFSRDDLEDIYIKVNHNE